MNLFMDFIEFKSGIQLHQLLQVLKLPHRVIRINIVNMVTLHLAAQLQIPPQLSKEMHTSNSLLVYFDVYLVL